MTTPSSEPVLLLDVNVLMALAWPTHQFHAHVVARLERQPLPRWATCALTQLGLVRLSCNPAVVGSSRTPTEAMHVLAALTMDARHEFLAWCPPIATAAPELSRALGHAQVTDAWLLAMARASGARLLTLDRRLRVLAGVEDSVEMLG